MLPHDIGDITVEKLLTIDIGDLGSRTHGHIMRDRAA
jgi:hypothetical protein